MLVVNTLITMEQILNWIYQWYESHPAMGNLILLLTGLGLALALKPLFAGRLTLLLFRLLPREQFRAHKGIFKHYLAKPIGLLFLLGLAFLAYQFFVSPFEKLGTQIEQFWLGVIIKSLYKLLLIGGFTWLMLKVMDFGAAVYLERNQVRQHKMGNQLIPFMRELLKIVVVILGLFTAMGAVFEVNVASIVAGLGIGGLAIALAGKETIENLFASFTIFLDQPFVVGDFVKIGNTKGVIEKVGFRSTRLRTLDKTYITIPNKKMVDDILENVSERLFFRNQTNYYLSNETQADSLEKFIKGIREILTVEDNSSFMEPHVYFEDIGDGYFKVFTLFWVNTQDDWENLSVKQTVNLKILELAQTLGIRFAERMR